MGKPLTLGDVGQPYGLKPTEVAAIAEADGIQPIWVNSRTRVLMPDQIEQIRPRLERVQSLRETSSPAVAQV